jgi:hypothetical protein
MDLRRNHGIKERRLMLGADGTGKIEVRSGQNSQTRGFDLRQSATDSLAGRPPPAWDIRAETK